MRTAPSLLLDPLTFRLRSARGGRRLLPIALPLIVAATACSKQDLKSELDRTRSWTATTALTSDRRSADAINGAVARQLADRAREARSQAAQSLGELAKSDSERMAARGVLDSLDTGLAHLRTVAR